MASPIYPLQRLTVSEWIDLADQEGWSRVELEDGKVIELSPTYGLHATTANRLCYALSSYFGVHRVGSGTVELDPLTAYEPDAIVLREGTDFDDLHPVMAAECLLVAEIAVSSAVRDLGIKSKRYAQSGIPEYWVIRPEAREGTLTRCRAPAPAGYSAIDRFEVGHRAERLDLLRVLETP